MLPLNPWEHYFPTKALYSVCMEPVCREHGITRTELDILLFLANNPKYEILLMQICFTRIQQNIKQYLEVRDL